MEKKGKWIRILSDNNYMIVCTLGKVICFLVICYMILVLTVHGIELVINTPVWNRAALTALLPYAALLGTMIVQRKAYSSLWNMRKPATGQRLSDGLKYLYYASIGKVAWTGFYLAYWIICFKDPYFVWRYMTATGFPAAMLAGELCMLLCLAVSSVPRVFAIKTIRKRIIDGKSCSLNWVRIEACANLLSLGGAFFSALVLMITDGSVGGGVALIILMLPFLMYYLSSAMTYENLYEILSSDDDTNTTEPLSAKL